MKLPTPFILTLAALVGSIMPLTAHAQQQAPAQNLNQAMDRFNQAMNELKAKLRV